MRINRDNFYNLSVTLTRAASLCTREVFYIVSKVSRRLVFRGTKQIVVTLVATTLEALLTVAKTNGRLPGRDFYSRNIYHFF